ncbi:helix-turn-helix domain-containing protein [Flagellimonas sp.]|uniref:helix-turn-helix domain-containing protein n=1 Tax=Flagellimonas sp. TaxID=2058762 RepID=UPI003B50DAB2
MEKLSKDQELLKLAKRVAQLRDEKGVSQQNAFNDTGIHFGRIEQGKRDISYFTLMKLCQYFEISLRDFFDGSFDVE